jgi:hypothetical protein
MQKACSLRHDSNKDSQMYPTGIIVTDAQLKALNIVRDPFHGEWNYIIKPQDTPSL